MSQEVATKRLEREGLLERLKEAQSKFGYVSEDVIRGLAESLELPVNEVYGVASFYSFLSIKPLGRNVIRVCWSLPCYLEHAEMIIESIAKELGIRPGETTSDGRFSLQLTNCVGLCDKAPAVMINHEVFGELTPEKIAQILNKYK